ncbi:serine aminopeptidase domain-containing protein [Rheinheimera gaetbuli]
MSESGLNKTNFYTMPSGKLFLRIEQSQDATSAVVVIPPFAEEMNKSRHLLTALMRQLAAKGCSCFMLDNYGTGDSEGDLDSATTAIWRADLQQLLSKLRDEGFEQVSFIAVRFGALQLFDLLNHSNLALTAKQLVLWQPMFDVTKFWQQFVRIKVAEAMAGGAKISQKDIEQQLTNGETVEIAGYPISPAFYQSLLHMHTTLPASLNQFELSWFETSLLDNIALPVQKQLQLLQQSAAVNFVQLKAESYWQTSELASADELISLTVQQLSAGTA